MHSLRGIARGIYNFRVPGVLRKARASARAKGRKIITLQRQLDRAFINYDVAVARARYIEQQVSLLRRNPMAGNPISLPLIGGTAREIQKWRASPERNYLLSRQDALKRALARLESQYRRLEGRNDPLSISRITDLVDRINATERELVDINRDTETATGRESWWRRWNPVWNNPSSGVIYEGAGLGVTWADVITRTGPRTKPKQIRLSNPGGEAVMADDTVFDKITNVTPMTENAEFLTIGAGNDPTMMQVQRQLPAQSVPGYRGRLINYNPRSQWMSFLASYRRSHPKPSTLAEGAALVKAAAAEYRLRHNPSFGIDDVIEIGDKPKFFGADGNLATILIATTAVALLGLWNKWKGSTV